MGQSFELRAMAENEAVDRLAEARIELFLCDAHSAELCHRAPLRSDLVGRPKVDRELAHPVALVEHEEIRVLSEAPGEDARGGAGRADDEDRANVIRLLHRANPLAASSSAAESTRSTASCWRTQSTSSGIPSETAVSDSKASTSLARETSA